MNELAMMAMTRAWASGIGTRVATADRSTPRPHVRVRRERLAQRALAAMLRRAGDGLFALAARLAH